MISFLRQEKNTENSQAILTRIAQADKSAVQDCVDVYGKMIWALAKQYTDSAADAEKAVPEIFMDIWKNAAFCNLEVSDEAVWIALIARRHLSGCALDKKCQPSTENFNVNFTNEYGKMRKTIATV